MPVRRRRDEIDDDDERDAPSASRYRDDEDDEDTPRARRRNRRNEEAFFEGAAEGSGRRPADDDAGEDADEAPARRRRARDDDDDADEPPRRRAAARGDDEDEDTPSRRRRAARDDDEDEPPARRRRASEDDDDDNDDAGRPKARSGFAGFREARKASGVGNRFDVTEDPVLIKILDDEPAATWNVHWVNKRPSTCVEEDCPLCDAGDTAKSVALFNVVEMNGKKPQVRPWEAGPGVVTDLEKKASARTGPLSKEYYAVSKYQQGKGPWKYDVDVVRTRDLEDEWGVAPLTDKQLDELEAQCKGSEYVKYLSRKELREIARGLDD